jgi:hypothetical protein
VLESPVSLGLGVRRGVLDAKRIKPAAKFDRESNRYFFPLGFGSAELYFERDFDHDPLTLPLPPGVSVFGRLPPPPLQVALRRQWVANVWPVRVMDLGEYSERDNDAMSADAEEGLRTFMSKRRGEG